MRALALDVGSKTIGLALSDEAGTMASPWEVLARRGQEPDSAEVLRRAREREVSVIVVGLPLELDGSEGHRARLVRRFLRALEAARVQLSDAPGIELWDERYSTSAAERAMIEGGASRAKRKQHIDAVAAQFILQGWLDSRPAALSGNEEVG